MRYWYNVRTGEVQTDETRGMGEDVMGPYDTREDAARALELAKEKTEKWDADERAWHNRGATQSWSGDEDSSS